MSLQSTEKQARILLLASMAAMMAWPVGHLLGLVLAAGQGGPGHLVAGSIGAWVSVIIWVIALLTVVWRGRISLRNTGKSIRGFAYLSFAILPAAIVWSSVSTQSYSMRVWNSSGAAIHDVSVYMGDRSISFGAMGSATFAVKAGLNARPSPLAEVHWKDEGEESHKVKVDLSELIPGRFDDGVLTFTINSNVGVSSGFFIDKGKSF